MKPPVPNPAEPRILVPYHSTEAISVKEAAAIAGKSPRTVLDYCERHGLGRRVGGGTWKVSRVALAMFLDGDHSALSAYHAGNRADEAVAGYYCRLGIGQLLKMAEFQR
jgi:hypothetical protein